MPRGKLGVALVLVGVVAAAVSGAWGLRGGVERGGESVQRLVGPLPDAPHLCPVSQARARARAEELEALASQAWERVPFDYAEAPLAWLRMREAEACFRAGAELLGAQRAGQRARLFEDDIGRMWVKSVLALEVAWEQRAMQQVGREVRVQQALLSRGGPETEGYRGWLASLGRKAERAAEGSGL